MDIFVKVKVFLAWYLQNRSTSYSMNIFDETLKFMRNIVTPVKAIRSVDLINYRSQLDQNREHSLSVISAALKQWDKMGYPGIDKSALVYCSEAQFKIPQKGRRVLTMDPREGPFTDIELQAIHVAINKGLASKVILLRDFVMIKIYMHLGIRPIQLAALKVCDFQVQQASDDSHFYTLSVPRAKQNGVPRESFKERKITTDLGEAITCWIQEISEVHEKRAQPKHEKAVSVHELPLFPTWGDYPGHGMLHHSSSSVLINRLNYYINKIDVISERTGEKMKINAYRFRITLGTRAAEEGHGPMIIAELLDHTDTQQVGIYVKATSKILDRIDKATAFAMAPMAQAFMGLIISDEKDAERAKDLASHIGQPDLGNVGSCGSYNFCNALAPIACYTCRFFQPWADAPHEEFLEKLIDERDKLLDQTGDKRIASTNDRTILAVAEVAQTCQKMRG